MSNISQFFSGGGVLPQPFDQRFVFTSSTYIAPVDGTLAIFAAAGDGSAGLCLGIGCATGAGAAESGIKLHPVKAGDAIVITLGAGGAAVVRSSSGQSNGFDGGNTTITGPNGLNILLVGGKGGKAAAASVGITLLGGEGGFGGYGADLHLPGGRGGNITNGGSNNYVTGGGALNGTRINSTSATRGGDMNGTGANSGPAATGGGGYGGRGADLVTNGISAGGGSGGDAIDGVYAAGKCGPNIVGFRGSVTLTAINNSAAPFGLSLTGCGGDGTNAAGDGGGSAGAQASSPLMAGSFGGFGGAFINTALNMPTLPALYGAFGGWQSSNTALTLPKGRDGFAILRLYPKVV